MRKVLPIGMDDFKAIRMSDCCYANKTEFIADLLHMHGEANLFLRPRGSGKSTNLRMLQSFFEIGADKRLFEGLRIMEEEEICKKYQGQYPVIFISLTDAYGENYEEAVRKLRVELAREARRFPFLADSERLTPRDRQKYQEICNGVGNVGSGLRLLSDMLRLYYERLVIVLVDDYDIPMLKAQEKGYYNRMTMPIRQLLSAAMKSNPSLFFGVMTGCEYIGSESVFADLNNVTTYTPKDRVCQNWFGFTEEEVRSFLSEVGLPLDWNFERISAQCNRYQIGDAELFCPRDVVCECEKLMTKR